MQNATKNKVDFLKQPLSYFDFSGEISVKETHHSWVFLTDQYAYKLKKPVKNEYHDYTTLRKREYNCREELRLNRRLAAPIYLDVVPLCRDVAGKLSLDGNGQVIDWLVKMKRLPEEWMLDTAIKDNSLTAVEIEGAACRLARFYCNAVPEKIDFPQFFQRMEKELWLCRKVLLNPRFELDRSAVDRLWDQLSILLVRKKPLFRERILQKRIVEGHGDLRPEHVCIRPEPYFIDCLEFSRELRILDPIDDIAYLALECDLLGRPDIGASFFRHYGESCGHEVPESCRIFYKALRALVKARLAITHHLEPQYSRDPEWREKAQNYLAYIQRLIADSPII